MPRNYTVQSKIDADFSSYDDAALNQQEFLRIHGTTAAQDIAKQALVVLPPSYRLLRLDIDETHFEIALICDADQSLVYYVRAVIWPDVMLEGKPVTQTLVWRTNDVAHKRVTSGVTEDVFFNYLVEQYNIVASDANHTTEGKNFWIRQLGMAMFRGLFVYRYDLLESNLTRVLDHAVVRNNSIDLWGDAPKYEYILAVIAKSELPLSRQ